MALFPGRRRSSHKGLLGTSPLLSTHHVPSLSLPTADPSMLPVKADGPSGQSLLLPSKIIQQATRPLAAHVINVPSLSQIPSNTARCYFCHFKTKQKTSLDPTPPYISTPLGAKSLTKGVYTQSLMPLFSFYLESTPFPMCQLDWATKFPDIWLNVFLCVSGSAFGQINISISRPSKADCLPQCGGPLPIR